MVKKTNYILKILRSLPTLLGLIFVVFTIFAVIICYYYPYPNSILTDGTSAAYGPVLLSIEIAIAIFSISFSFLVYQSSQYRVLINEISIGQLIDSLSILMLSLVPLLFIVININYAPTLAIMTIPMVAYGSLLLTMGRTNETNPIMMLEKNVSDIQMNKFIESFIKDIQKQLSQLDEMKLIDKEDTSWDDLDFKTSPPAKLQDPLMFLASLALTSINNSDIYVFENVIQRLFEVSNLIDQYKIEYDEEKIVYGYYKDLFVQIASYSVKKSNIHAIKFLEISALFLRKNASEWGKKSEFSDFNFKLLTLTSETMLLVTEKLLEQDDYDSAMVTLLIIKQVAIKGVYHMNKVGDTSDLFINHIPYFASQIKDLGLIAIKIDHELYLHRCIKALDWLGCSAVKMDNIEVGKSCLQGLIYLGRESKRKKIECYDPHCPLTPFDHAEEGIYDMATWIHKLNNSEHQKWFYIIGKSLSRLNGKKTSIKLVKDEEGTINIKTVISDEAHKEIFGTDVKWIEHDYSNPSFKKDSDLR